MAKETTVTFRVFNKDFNKAIGEMKTESSKLRQEFNLQQEQLKLNGTEAEKLSSKLTYLQKSHQLAAQRVSETEKQLAKAKVVYGENSQEVQRMESMLLNAQIAEQRLANQVSQTNSEIEKHSKTNKQLNTILEATGKTLDDYADAIGSDLVRAIKKGEASSAQLESAIEKIGREALGSNVDIDKLRRALAEVDNGSSIDDVRRDLSNLSAEARDTADDIEGIGLELENVAGALVAGGGIAGILEKALDTSTLKTKIDITFEVPESSKKSVQQAVKSIEAFGVDAEASLEGVRRQWALNKDASDETNTSIVKGAAAIASAYSGLDFTELIQETNEIASELKISDENALGLVNSLLKAGFPPEQLDIIAEYGGQLERAGYSAEDIQGIFAAGVDTGTWNIDNLLDGLKEGRIKMVEFGASIDDATAQLLSDVGISQTQFSEWGKAVAGGGQEGANALVDVASKLAGVEDETLRNSLGVKVFGTMWEDQGKNIIDTLINAKDKTADVKENQEQLNDTVSKLEDSPAVEMKNAMNDINMALEPVYEGIAGTVKLIAEWARENPTLTATIVAVTTVIGILLGLAAALAPVFMIASTAGITWGTAMAFLTGTFLPIIAAIAAVIAIGVLLYQNWEWISAKAIEIWTALGDWFANKMEYFSTLFTTCWTSISEFFIGIWNGMKDFLTPIVESISEVISTAWNFIQGVTTAVWDFITAYIQGLWTALLYFVTPVFEGIKSVISTIWEFIKNITMTVWDSIKSVLEAVWNAIKAVAMFVWEALKLYFTTLLNFWTSIFSSVWNGIKAILEGIWNGILAVARVLWNGLKAIIIDPVLNIKDRVVGAFEGLKSGVLGAWDGIKSGISSAIKFCIKMINKFIDGFNIPAKIVSKIPGVDMPLIPNIPMLAKGGRPVGDGQFIVGEAGPELFSKKGNNLKVTPLSSSEKSMGVTGKLDAMMRSVNETIRNASSQLANIAIPSNYAVSGASVGQSLADTANTQIHAPITIHATVREEADIRKLAKAVNNELGDTNRRRNTSTGKVVYA